MPISSFRSAFAVALLILTACQSSNSGQVPASTAPQIGTQPEGGEKGSRFIVGSEMQARPGPAEPAGIWPANQTELDILLESKRWPELGAALSKSSQFDDVMRAMTWERAKLIDGASSFIGFLYARDLWRVANTLAANGQAAQADNLRGTAGMIALYTFALIALDAPKCQDVSAPAHRRDQLVAQNRESLRYVATLPAEERQKIVDIAVRLEKRTAGVRGYDDFLCRGGLDELARTKGLKDLQIEFPSKPGDGVTVTPQGEAREVSTPPGHVGRTFVVPSDPAYQPKFTDPAIWQAKQAATRDGLRDLLLRIVTPAAKP